MKDYGDVIAPDAVRIERVLPGPIERVWSFLTHSDKRATWLAAGEMDLRAGGRVEHIFRNSDLSAPDDVAPAKYAHVAGEARLQGRIMTCEPPHLLSYTWGEDPDSRSEVQFELTSQADKVLLVVTHRRLATRETMISVAAGWHAHLAILASHLEDRPPESFWAMHTRLESQYERRIPSS